MNLRQTLQLFPVLALTLALGAGLLHWRLISSANDAHKATLAQIATLEQRIAGDDVHQQLEALHQTLALQQASIPANREVAAVLEMLARDLQAMGVSERSITTDPAVTVGPIIHMPLSVSFRSSFQSAFQWLEHLQQYDRLVRVERLILRRDPAPDAQGHMLTVHARLITFGQSQEVSP